MTREETLSFLQSCIDKVNIANGQDIQFYKEMYNKDCTMPVESSDYAKEQQIQEYETKLLIDKLSKMPPMVIAIAYLHAINYTLYGEDVTEKWITATQNASTLEKAYMKGYYDALQRQQKGNVEMMIFEEKAAIIIDQLRTDRDKLLDMFDKMRAEIAAIDINGQVDEHTMFVRSAEQVKQMALEIIDKCKAEYEDEI